MKVIKEGISKAGKRVWMGERNGEYRVAYNQGKKIGHNAYYPTETNFKPSEYWLKKAEAVYKSFLRDINPFSHLSRERDLVHKDMLERLHRGK